VLSETAANTPRESSKAGAGAQKIKLMVYTLVSLD
jgi:hypothetical protein